METVHVTQALKIFKQKLYPTLQELILIEELIQSTYVQALRMRESAHKYEYRYDYLPSSVPGGQSIPVAISTNSLVVSPGQNREADEVITLMREYLTEIRMSYWASRIDKREGASEEVIRRLTFIYNHMTLTPAQKALIEEYVPALLPEDEEEEAA